MRLPTQDSATGRGLKTALQTAIGLIIGLGAAIVAVPGVPEAIKMYLSNHLLEVLLLVGVPSGVSSFVWNYFRPKIKNY